MIVRGKPVCPLPLHPQPPRPPIFRCRSSGINANRSPVLCVRGLLPRSVQISKKSDGRSVRTLAAPVAAAAAGAAASAGLNIWVQWLLGIGGFVVCITGSIFMIAALPTLVAVRRAARRMEVVMVLMEKEMPDTMRALRLSSLEITDCIEEFTDLGSDVVSGVRASASAVVAADRGVRQAAMAVTEGVIPAIKARAPAARESLEGSLRDRARQDYAQPIAKKVGRSTARKVKAARTILKTANLGGKALSLWRVGRGIQKGLARARDVESGRYNGSNSSKKASSPEVQDSGQNQSTKPQGVA
ncbi:hypothetical protein BSKO_08324 [Bryopsis sp. KO-2023]|nr:hypothetical protein BSKO_08324 [Bryopsis sp. KO-2023]